MSELRERLAKFKEANEEITVPFHDFYEPTLGDKLTIAALMKEHTRLTIDAILAIRDFDGFRHALSHSPIDVSKAVETRLFAQIDDWSPKYRDMVPKFSQIDVGAYYLEFWGALVRHTDLVLTYARAKFATNYPTHGFPFMQELKDAAGDKEVEALVGKNAERVAMSFANAFWGTSRRKYEPSVRSGGLPRIVSLWKEHVVCTKKYIDIIAERRVSMMAFDQAAAKCLRTSHGIGEQLDSMLEQKYVGTKEEAELPHATSAAIDLI